MNRIKQLFGIEYPIIQAGMIWCSGWELASAVSNAGGLGIIGAGSMYPEVLRDQILKCKAVTDRPFAVNVPLLYPSIEEHMATIVELGVPIVFTSAGNPKTWTEHLEIAWDSGGARCQQREVCIESASGRRRRGGGRRV